ncbi:MAG: ATP-binding protein [Candidatus Acidiferrales bacterium]
MKSRSEFEDIVHAIRRGGIDALVVSGTQGDEVVVLQGAEQPYRVLVENFTDGAATLDSSGAILYVNDRLAEILGRSPKQLIGTRLLDHLPWSGREQLERMIRKRVRGEVVLKSEGEPERTIRFTLGPSKGTPGNNLCLIATELTEMVHITEALRSSEQSLRELSARLLALQDEERRRIARDLHDITGQSLAVQSMMLWNLLDREPALGSEARKTLAECAEVNKRITDEVRTLSYLLHPPLIEELGLAPAVKWYVEGFSTRSGIAISVEVDPDFPRLSPDAEIALFRIVQESLTNVHRYSGSSRGHVRLHRQGGEIVLEVKDFGKGMRAGVLNLNPQESTLSLGVGILGMRERVRQLSGKLEITSREDDGTLVAVILPIHKPAAAPAGKPDSREPATRKPASKAAKSGR